MAGIWSRCLLTIISCCLLFFVASASVTEQVLINPLLEVGRLWFEAASTVHRRVIDSVTTMPDLYHWKTYVYFAIFAVAVRIAYLIFIKPLNRVRKLGDTGYIAEGSFSVKETANYVQKRRKVGNVPPVYPNGWFAIMESFSLQKGRAVSVSMLGQNLAVFRDEQGCAHALDAYCPHMGANLAAGGRVIGDCLECPFHAWRFRGQDGKCTKIPYAEKIPEIAKVKSWPVEEVNGWIYMWYHAEDVDPTWRIPEIQEITKGKWVYRGRTEHFINAHIEEIPENGADVSHLAHVHGPIIGAGIDLRYMWSKAWSFAQHHWTAAWEALPEPNGHIGQLKLTHSITVFGFHLPFFDLRVTAQQIGPGVVYLYFEGMFGNGVFLQGLTPMEPMLQKLVHNIYVTYAMPIPIAKFYMLGEGLQVERDVMIWNNKQYEGRPMFVKSKEDSLISRHRRWYSQFYSENSPRLHFQKDSMEW
ncbi:hypothetical protein ACOMHN_064509 [Nucella lapillus]